MRKIADVVEWLLLSLIFFAVVAKAEEKKCVKPCYRIQVYSSEEEKYAKERQKLVELIIKSFDEQSQGITNVKTHEEIRKLAKELSERR